MTKAAPSSRAFGHLTFSFGVVTFPISVYTGTDASQGITRNEYVVTDDGDHPVGRGQTDKATGELIEPGAEIHKKIQTEYGPVYVEDPEIEHLFEIAPDTVVVKGFQPQHLFHQGNYVPKSLYFVEPRKTGSGAKKGPDPISSKLLMTLLKGMREKGAIAIVEMTTRGIPKPCVLLPDGTLWQVYHTDAIREQRELPEVEVVDAEVDMLGNLIDTLWSTEVMDLSDKRSELIQAFADEKAQAGDFDKPDVDTSKPAEPAASVDLMALLSASVEKAKSDKEAI